MELDIYKYFRYLYNIFHFYKHRTYIHFNVRGSYRDINVVCILHIDIDIRIQNDLTTYHQILFHL